MPPLEPDDPLVPLMPPLEPDDPLVPDLPLELPPVLLGLLGFPVDPDDDPLMPPCLVDELPMPSSP